jgi:hypothetical protein
MSPSSHPESQIDTLVNNPGFRMAMSNALKSERSLPKPVLQSLVNDDHFLSIFLEAIGPQLEPGLPKTLEQEHFTKLADDGRIQFLLKDLLESHLRFRDRLSAIGRWILSTFKAWAEKAIGVNLGGSGSHGEGISPVAGGSLPHPGGTGRSSIVTLITTLLLGGGAVVVYHVGTEIRDFKSEYHQNQRIDNSYSSMAYWHELHELEERTRKDFRSDFNSFTSQIDNKMSLISSKQSSEVDNKTKQDIIRTVREDIHKSVDAELTEKYDKRLTAIETFIPAGFYWAASTGCPNNKGAVSATGYAPAWASCCCSHESSGPVAAVPTPTPASTPPDKGQVPVLVDVAGFSRLDTESVEQKLGSQLSSSVIFRDGQVTTVLYPVSSRGYERCMITLSNHSKHVPDRDETPVAVGSGIYGTTSCDSERLAAKLNKKEFYIPYRLAKKWIFYAEVLAFVRIDPVHGGRFHLHQEGWRVSIQAGSYAPELKAKDNTAVAQSSGP